MAKKAVYKYINLLFRLILGVSAVIYICSKVSEDWQKTLTHINFFEVKIEFLVVAFLLVFFNWGIEAFKWQYAIQKTVKISFFKAFNYTLTGISAGLLTPNRVGEIPFRALMLGKDNFKDIALKTLVSSYSQLIITILIGTFGVLFTYQLFSLNINITILFVGLILISMLMLLFYFKISKLKTLLDKVNYFKKAQIGEALQSFSVQELIIILLLSLLRYLIFSLQYFLILKAFGIDFTETFSFLLIPVCFMIASVIPTILISEIAVRASVAIFVFGVISNSDVSIMAASIVLWVFNVAFTALLGLFSLRKIKILSAS